MALTIVRGGLGCGPALNAARLGPVAPESLHVGHHRFPIHDAEPPDFRAGEHAVFTWDSFRCRLTVDKIPRRA